MQKVRRQSSRFKGRAELWVPATEGAERLGVQVTNLLSLGRFGVIRLRWVRDAVWVDVWSPPFVRLRDELRKGATREAV